MDEYETLKWGEVMSDHLQYLEEKRKIDSYFEKGYQIVSIFENLSGTFVDFVTSNDSGEREIVQLQLLTAESRKYIASKLIIN